MLYIMKGNKMELFTYIMEIHNKNFSESTVYFFQRNGYCLNESIINWIKHIDIKKIKNIGNKSLHLFNNLINETDDFPIQYNGLLNVWNSIIPINNYKYFSEIQIILSNEDNGHSLFTFMLLYLGGTYLDQVYGENLEDAIQNWIQDVGTNQLQYIKWLGKKLLKEMNEILNTELGKPKSIDKMINMWESTFKLNHNRYLTKLIIVKTKE